MAYRVAICDDCAADAQFVSEILKAWADERGAEVNAEIYPSAESFLFAYDENKAYDMLLLDIEMGGMDGVSMARRVRAGNKTVQIIFITGYSDYIAEGYDVAALHYLMKPVNREKLFGVLDRAGAVERLKISQRCLNLDMGGEMVRIPLYEIRYIDVRQNYVTVHAEHEYTVKRTLNEFEKEMDGGFTRVGRSMIVNLNRIRRVTKAEVMLNDGTVLPLPRGAYEPLNRAIIQNT